MEFDREVIQFGIFENLKNPNDTQSDCSVAVIDSIPEGVGEINGDD